MTTVVVTLLSLVFAVAIDRHERRQAVGRQRRDETNRILRRRYGDPS